MKKRFAKKAASFITGLAYARGIQELDRIRKMPGTDIGTKVELGESSLIVAEPNFKKIQIGQGVSFRKFCNIMVYPHAALSIGENVFFNNYCSINCLGEIEVGDNCIFGEGVKFYDHNHGYYYNPDGTLIVQTNAYTIGKIKIGKNCWIGSNVTILNNVEIGDNVIIGANCLLYKSVPSNSMVKHAENLIITQAT